MTISNRRPNTSLRTLIAAFGICLLTTGAQACLFYKETQTATKLWGLPEENTSSVQAEVPANARVCIEEQLPGRNGEKWARVSFYVTDEIRYRARGWVNLARFAKTANTDKVAPEAKQPAPPAIALPAPDTATPAKTKPDSATTKNTDPDDDAMIDTLQAQRRELDQLKDQNAQLKKRLGSLKKTAPKMVDELQKHGDSKISPLPAADPLFLQQGWRLNSSKSKLSVESVTDGSLIETHHFTRLSGQISRDGDAQIKVDLNAINSGIKIRDIRLSHLLFESEKFPNATITTRIDKKQFAPLQKDGKQKIDLKVKLKLHGVEKEMKARVKLARMSDGRLLVSSLSPIMVSAADFALSKGITNLINIAGGKSIIPVVPVRFKFVFDADT